MPDPTTHAGAHPTRGQALCSSPAVCACGKGLPVCCMCSRVLTGNISSHLQPLIDVGHLFAWPAACLCMHSPSSRICLSCLCSCHAGCHSSAGRRFLADLALTVYTALSGQCSCKTACCCSAGRRFSLQQERPEFVGAHLSSEPVPVRAPRLEECSSSETYGSKSSPEDSSAHGSDAIGQHWQGQPVARHPAFLCAATAAGGRASLSGASYVLCCHHKQQFPFPEANAVRFMRFVCIAEQTACCALVLPEALMCMPSAGPVSQSSAAETHSQNTPSTVDYTVHGSTAI